MREAATSSSSRFSHRRHRRDRDLYVGEFCLSAHAWPGGLAESTTPASSVMRALLGPRGGQIIAAGIAFSAFGFLAQSMLTAPRVYFAMAADRVFFRSVAWVHPKSHVPVVAIGLQGVWAIVIAVTGTVRTGRQLRDRDGLHFLWSDRRLPVGSAITDTSRFRDDRLSRTGPSMDDAAVHRRELDGGCEHVRARSEAISHRARNRNRWSPRVFSVAPQSESHGFTRMKHGFGNQQFRLSVLIRVYPWLIIA